MSNLYPVGALIDERSDGSFIYMSSLGVMNLDNHFELCEAEEMDRSYLSSLTNDRNEQRVSRM